MPNNLRIPLNVALGLPAQEPLFVHHLLVFHAAQSTSSVMVVSPLALGVDSRRDRATMPNHAEAYVTQRSAT